MNERGISLVSMIVALTLLSIGLSTLVRSSAYTIGVRAGSSNRASAMYIADTYLEQLKIRSNTLTVSETPTMVDRRGTIDPSGVFSRSVDIDRSIAPDLIKATVAVEYSWALGRRRSVEISTFIYKGGL